MVTPQALVRATVRLSRKFKLYDKNQCDSLLILLNFRLWKSTRVDPSLYLFRYVILVKSN